MQPTEQSSHRTIPVRFEGAGSGEAPLTWAQVDVWQSMTDSGEAVTLGGIYPMPAGVTVEQVADMLAFIMGRHQALRTRLRIEPDGRPRQVCVAAGETSLLVQEATSEPAAVADRLKARLEQRGFDYERDWPARLAVVTVDNLVTHLVAVYLHLAVDAGGIEALAADLASRDSITGLASAPVTAVQPLELARRQATPAQLRQSAASLEHLAQVLRTVRPKLFGEPSSSGPARYQKLGYHSPATALAIRRISAEHNVTSSSALLAMFALGLARHLQDGTVWTMVLVHNRFRPGLAESVSQLAQSSPYLIDVGGLSLAEVVSRTQRGLLHTYKTAYYDRYHHDELVARIDRERAEPVEMGCYYNDRSARRGSVDGGEPATDSQLEQAAGRSSWTERFENALPAAQLFMNVDDQVSAVEFEVSFNSSYLTLAETVELMRQIEASAIETAITPHASSRLPPADLQNPARPADRQDPGRPAERQDPGRPADQAVLA